MAHSCTSCRGGVHGLGEMSSAEAGKIVEDYFNQMPLTDKISLGAQLAGGDTSGLEKHVQNIAEKICTAGFTDKIKQYWYVIAIAVVGGYLMLRK